MIGAAHRFILKDEYAVRTPLWIIFNSYYSRHGSIFEIEIIVVIFSLNLRCVFWLRHAR